MPCGDCNACCRTSHYIHVRPEEKRARKRLPQRATSPGAGPAARLPACSGYDQDGRCPVLDRRPVHDLRGPAADLPHLRLPHVRRDRRRAGQGGRSPRRSRWRVQPTRRREDRARARTPSVRGRRLHPRASRVPAAASAAARPADPRRHAAPSPVPRDVPAGARRSAPRRAGPRRRRPGSACTPSPTPTRRLFGRRLTPRRPPRIPCGQPPAPAGGARRPKEATMGKELSILAHDTVDQPPPATRI